MKHTFLPIAACVLCLLVSGPVQAEQTTKAPAAASVNYDGRAIKGKIMETMDASGYTYVKLAADKGDVWVAIPQAKVTKGTVVTTAPGMTMTNFASKTLNKTFDAIIFSSGLIDPNKQQSSRKGATMGETGGTSFDEALQAEMGTSPHAGTGMPGGGMMGGAGVAAMSGGSASAIVPASEITIDKAPGDKGQTVADCFNKARQLNNKTVRVHGKVMKVSRMIMGKNWVHLQDGTGNPIKNTHDLVVTTLAEPAVDSIITIEGTLHADKDFGAGYKYAVIIEDAVLQ